MAKNSTYQINSFIAGDGKPLRYSVLTPRDPEETLPERVLIYVPGLGGSFKGAIDFMPKLLPGFQAIYSLDPRGFGVNEEKHPRFFPASYYKDFQPFLEHLRQRQLLKPGVKLVLCGLSLGGILSTVFLIDYPHPFEAAILMAPAFTPHPNLFTPAYRLSVYRQILMKGPLATIPLPYGLNELTRIPEKYDDPIFQDPLEMPPFYLLMVEFLCKKAIKRLPHLTLPIGMVIPGQDLVCDPAAMQAAFDNMPNPKNKAFCYALLYHDLMMEPDADQQQIADDLLDWLGTL